MSNHTIVTHSGPFHADDLIACGLLRYEGVEGAIVRTRNEEFLRAAKECRAYLVDVGGEFNPALRRFDHHFKPQPQREDGTLLASAGMVAEHFHEEDWIKQMARKVDSVDNGIKVENWGLSLTIHKCNPVNGTESVFFERFTKLVYFVDNALAFAADELSFVETIQENEYVRSWVAEHDLELEKSKTRIREAFGKGSLLLLQQYEPAFHEVAWEAPEETLFAVYPSPSGEWMIQQIPKEKGSFEGRKPLPEQWAGKRGEDLDKITGLSGCVFTHPGRFIGGHKTLEGIKQMAALATSL